MSILINIKVNYLPYIGWWRFREVLDWKNVNVSWSRLTRKKSENVLPPNVIIGAKDAKYMKRIVDSD